MEPPALEELPPVGGGVPAALELESLVEGAMGALEFESLVEGAAGALEFESLVEGALWAAVMTGKAIAAHTERKIMADLRMLLLIY